MGGGLVAGDIVSYPGEESNEEEAPLLRSQHAKKADGVGDGEHGRTQGAEARLDVCAGAHTLMRRTGARLLAGHDVVVTHDGGFFCLAG